MVNYLYSELQRAIEKVRYEGLASQTAAVIINQDDNTIQVNVTQIPAELLEPHIDKGQADGRHLLVGFLSNGIVNYSWVNIEDFLASLEQQNEALNNRITQEATRTDNMINQLNENVNQSIADLNNNLVQAINTINGGIEEERQTRATADSQLQSNIDTEVNDRKAAISDAVNTINSAIAEEVSTRKQVDQHLWDILPDNIIAGTLMQGLENADAVNIVFSKYQKHGVGEDPAEGEIVEVPNQAITLFPATQEVAGVLTSADKIKIDNIATDISTAVSNEAALREQADDTLNTKIDTTASNITATVEENYNTLNTSIEAETARAQAAEQELQTDLNNEIQRATAAESTLQSAISSEATARQEADNQLQQNIDTVSSNLQALDNIAVKLTGQSSQSIQGDITIQGDLLVNGTTTTNDTETLTVKDNIIVTNSDGVTLNNLSGLFIKTGTTTGYAVVYDPSTSTVILGEGTIDDTNEVAVVAEERKAIVTRPDNDSALTNGNLTYWDSSTRGITTSNIAVDEVVIQSELESQVNNLNNAINTKQNSTDNTLETTSKTVVGAINEVDEEISAHINNTNNPHAVTKAQLGIENVDNTSDLDKPVSTATQTALNSLQTTLESTISSTTDALRSEIEKELELKVDSLNSSISTVSTALTTHEADTANPHSVTAEQIGLGNVDNTSDLDKPISNAVQSALNNKVTVEAGKGLSTNDFTTADKEKLDGIQAGAQVNTVTSVAGKTGVVTLVKDDVGLSNVANELQYSASNPQPITYATLQLTQGGETLGSFTAGPSGTTVIDIPDVSDLPLVTTSDNGKFLSVQDGQYTLTTLSFNINDNGELILTYSY